MVCCSWHYRWYIKCARPQKLICLNVRWISVTRSLSQFRQCDCLWGCVPTMSKNQYEKPQTWGQTTHAQYCVLNVVSLDVEIFLVQFKLRRNILHRKQRKCDFFHVYSSAWLNHSLYSFPDQLYTELKHTRLRTMVS